MTSDNYKRLKNHYESETIDFDFVSEQLKKHCGNPIPSSKEKAEGEEKSSLDINNERKKIMDAWYKSEITTDEMWKKIEEINKKGVEK